MLHWPRPAPRRPIVPRRPGARALIVTATTALLSTPLPSAAGTLASAVVQSSDAQRADCFLSNVGRAPVAITQLTIVSGGATTLLLTAENCTPALSPGANCAFTAPLDSRLSARGLVEVRGSTKHLRGQCQLTTSTGRAVASSDLR